MEKKVDPGWNDPPMLNYSASNPPPKSRITNKRVAFPLGSNATTQLQPMSSTNKPPSQTSCDGHNESCSLTENSNISDATKLFQFRDNENKEIFLDLWQQNKFPLSCKQCILLLSKYLKENDTKNVIETKEKLVAEYKSYCDSWLNNIDM